MSWFSDWLSRLGGTYERPSPKIRIKPEQVTKLPDGTIQIKGFDPDSIIVHIAPSNSMEPVIDDEMLVIEEPVRDVTDLIVGDIIYYDVGKTRAIHRIIKIGQDGQGWYC